MARPDIIPANADSARAALRPAMDVLRAVLASRQAASPTARVVRGSMEQPALSGHSDTAIRRLFAACVASTPRHVRCRASFWQANTAPDGASDAA